MCYLKKLTLLDSNDLHGDFSAEQVDTRLFQSHMIREIGGMKILFIGILTQEVRAKAKSETLISTLVDVCDATTDVGKICDSYRTEDIDLTVLLTHIGIEADKELAAILDPAGVWISSLAAIATA